MVAETSERKFKANIARNARAKFLLDLSQKRQKTDYFREFHFT